VFIEIIRPFRNSCQWRPVIANLDPIEPLLCSCPRESSFVFRGISLNIEAAGGDVNTFISALLQTACKCSLIIAAHTYKAADAAKMDRFGS